MEKRKSFCIICIANYCRSPVLENLLKNKFKDRYEFYSAGINPLYKPGMDPRSTDFLDTNGIKNIIHTPKRLNQKMVDYFDYLLAIDLFVLMELNKKFSKYKYKIKLATAEFNDIDIIDPYRFDHENYLKVMEDIKNLSKKINLDFF